MDIQSLLSSFSSDKGGNDFIGSALNLIGGNSGGINGLMQLFSSKGLGDLLQSWIGTGQNLPVSPEQIRSVFGDEKLAEISKKTGADTQKTSSDLSQFLPEFIDKITPGGKVPGNGFEGLNMDMLSGLFK